MNENIMRKLRVSAKEITRLFRLFDGGSGQTGRRFLQVLLLAAAYVFSGWLGSLLAVPPGYASAVFPAAGVALAALLLYGAPLAPGVWRAVTLPACTGVFAVGVFVPTAFATQLRIGDIGKQPTMQTKVFAPFVNYLVTHLQAEGVTQGRVVVVQSIPEMGAALREGKVDLFMDSVFPAAALVRLAAAKLLLRRWKRGVAEYWSIIIVRKDSGINRLEDLAGKTIAFEERFSTMSYFIPKTILIRKGLKLRELGGPADKVGANEVGYIFVGDDPNTTIWVSKGKASAGVVGTSRYDVVTRASYDELRIIHESVPLPRQVIAHRADLPPRLVARIRELLLNMEKTEEGRKVLKHMEDTARFDEIPDRAMSEIKTILPLVGAEFGIR